MHPYIFVFRVWNSYALYLLFSTLFRHESSLSQLALSCVDSLSALLMCKIPAWNKIWWMDICLLVPLWETWLLLPVLTPNSILICCRRFVGHVACFKKTCYLCHLFYYVLRHTKAHFASFFLLYILPLLMCKHISFCSQMEQKNAKKWKKDPWNCSCSFVQNCLQSG